MRQHDTQRRCGQPRDNDGHRRQPAGFRRDVTGRSERDHADDSACHQQNVGSVGGHDDEVGNQNPQRRRDRRRRGIDQPGVARVVHPE